MIADSSHEIQAGSFEAALQFPSTYKIRLVEFIADCLPKWRDDKDRPPIEAETALTEYLCNFLAGAARKSTSFSQVQFQPETRDETQGGRKIDLTPKPLDTSIYIGNKLHTKYQSLFPIECKRLPTPRDPKRDEREYVVAAESNTTGGIQRFKFGDHGASHEFGAMIGYVQEGKCSQWFAQVNLWIDDLTRSRPADWEKADCLTDFSEDSHLRISRMGSRHKRKGRDDIQLQHVWITMN